MTYLHKDKYINQASNYLVTENKIIFFINLSIISIILMTCIYVFLLFIKIVFVRFSDGILYANLSSKLEGLFLFAGCFLFITEAISYYQITIWSFGKL